MAYTAYEPSTPANAALAQVVALHLGRTNAGAFDSSTRPTLTEVEQHLTTIYRRIAAKLVAVGIAQAQTDDDVLGALMDYNARGAAYLIELSQASQGFAATEGGGRLAEFAKWESDLDSLLATDALEQLGATMVTTTRSAAGATAGGISISDKDDIDTDTDFEPLAFKRRGFSAAGQIEDLAAPGER